MNKPTTSLAKWWPDFPPIYDIEKTYLQNAEEGPFFTGSYPERNLTSEDKWFDFLGFSVASPLGVASGPLLNSKWIELAACMGFDIVTYKTIRSREYFALPLPNMVYLESNRVLERNGETVKIAKHVPLTMSDLSATNSFGMPSRSPTYLLADIARANALLGPGQVMIVSIVGTYSTYEEMIADYTKTACLAKEGGAKILEANFSCPNVSSCEGSLYTSPEASSEIATSIISATGLPLIAKVGTFENKTQMKKVFIALAKAGVRGIAGINTVSATIINEKGEFALGDKRKTAGVCGEPIRKAALNFIRWAKAIIKEEKLDLILLATGGVTHYSHFDLFLNEGADVAMTALGMMWNPYLAAQYHQHKEEIYERRTCTSTV